MMLWKEIILHYYKNLYQNVKLGENSSVVEYKKENQNNESEAEVSNIQYNEASDEKNDLEIEEDFINDDSDHIRAIVLDNNSDDESTMEDEGKGVEIEEVAKNIGEKQNILICGDFQNILVGGNYQTCLVVYDQKYDLGKR
ncbi:hypothetical protein ABPG73_004629 [Tetrahymena malaccensis]